MALPLETLHEIMAYWGGHRLGLTCAALYSRLDVGRYVVKTNDGRIMHSRLPNGVYHGVTMVTHAKRKTMSNLVIYDRGAIRRVEYFRENARYWVTLLVAGIEFCWNPGQGFVKSSQVDIMLYATCTYRDLDATVARICAGNRGTQCVLRVFALGDATLPHTY